MNVHQAKGYLLIYAVEQQLTADELPVFLYHCLTEKYGFDRTESFSAVIGEDLAAELFMQLGTELHETAIMQEED